MIETIVFWDWLEFALRWFHIVTAIAWIGSSFYFIALDLGLRQATGLPPGAHGEEWQVHGGGFYHIRKFLVAPKQMPEHLTWFKWESYATWLSGAALLVLVYWVGAELYLIDGHKADLAIWQGIAISAGSLAIGWVAYDTLCKSWLEKLPSLLMLVLFAVLVAMGWGYSQIFTGRATLLHLGAFTATIMTANVFFVIIPNQRVVVTDLKAGRKPDPKLGAIAKLRSTHNNYLTLPVIFLMLSPHYPLAFATEYNWIIAALVFLMGVTIRHYFNTRHTRAGNPLWTWPITLLLFLAIIWLSTLKPPYGSTDAEGRQGVLPEGQKRFADAESFPDAVDTVLNHCSACHAREPVWTGIGTAPKGMLLETETDIARNARLIYLHAGISTAMPPANITWMEPEERNLLVTWYRNSRQPL